MGNRFCSVILAALLLPAPVLAAGDSVDSDSQGRPRDPVIAAFERAKAANDWIGAARVAREALARSPDNAEYHNRYAFALRKGPSPDMELVFRHYREALRLDPEHRGAHEYIGEAYLMVGDLGKAKQHLAVLDRLCLFGCEEYDDLKREVAAYEARGQTPSVDRGPASTKRGLAPN
jgi:tetratricopeptide (TPR) repeat protein